MATENAENGFIRDTEPQKIKERERKKIPSRKTTEKVQIEQVVTEIEQNN